MLRKHHITLFNSDGKRTGGQGSKGERQAYIISDTSGLLHRFLEGEKARKIVLR